MANQLSTRQSQRQGDRQQSTAMERADAGERGLAARECTGIRSRCSTRCSSECSATSSAPPLLNALRSSRTRGGRGQPGARALDQLYRQIPLPDDIDSEQPEASYRDGMLTVRFPKRKARSSAREVLVTTQQSGRAAPCAVKRPWHGGVGVWIALETVSTLDLEHAAGFRPT